jgi:hypothetical protein
MQIKLSLCQSKSGKEYEIITRIYDLVKAVRRLKKRLKKKILGLFLLYVGLKKGLMKGI